MSLSIDLIARADSELVGLTARQRASDYALVALLEQAHQFGFAAGTLDLGALLESVPDTAGMSGAAWIETLAISRGPFAIALGDPRFPASALAIWESRDPERARAVFETAARQVTSRPIVDATNQWRIDGRARVQRVHGEDVHETVTSVLPQATRETRSSFVSTWGAMQRRHRFAVFGAIAAMAVGLDAVSELAVLGDRLVRSLATSRRFSAAAGSARMPAMGARRFVLSIALLAACRSGAPPAPPGLPSGEAPAASEAPRPPIDPSLAPDHLVASFSVGDPGALRDGLIAYAAGLPAEMQGVVGMVAAQLDQLGLDLARPIHGLTLRAPDGDVRVVLAGGVGDAARLRDAIDDPGALRIQGSLAAFGDLVPDDAAAAHAMWRVGQPTPPHLHVWIAGDLVAEGVAALPTAELGPPHVALERALAVFRDLEQITGTVRFTGTDASLTVSLAGRPGNPLGDFAARQRPSDYGLAGAVMRPGQLAFAAGTLALGDEMASFAAMSGLPPELWAESLALAEGPFAMGLTGSAGQWSVVSAMLLTDGDRGRALYESLARAAAKQPIRDEVNHLETRGRPRVGKLRGAWVHEQVVAPSRAATPEQRRGFELIWGKAVVQRLAVFGSIGAYAMGHDAPRALAALADRLARPGPISDPAVRAVLDESRGLGETALLAFDATRGSAGVSPVRVGAAFTGGVATLRIVLPAGQLDGLAQLGEALVTAGTPP
jgi:hypothetical protein